MNKKVIAVDLDGTLAAYHGWQGVEHIGRAIPSMLNRVKRWIANGDKVVIFTARVGHPGALPYIKAWLNKQGLPDLEVTNVKSSSFSQIWDDRAIQVKTNLGMPFAPIKGEKDE